MSITLDVNAFLNKDVCTTGCDDIVMEKEMETNIFDEIEHLLKFNKVWERNFLFLKYFIFCLFFFVY